MHGEGLPAFGTIVLGGSVEPFQLFFLVSARLATVLI
jgi:hypothetical protein